MRVEIAPNWLLPMGASFVGRDHQYGGFAHFTERDPSDHSIAIECEAYICGRRYRIFARIRRPGGSLGIGMNYADHAAEAKIDLPKDQLWFSKALTGIANPFGTVFLLKVSDALDYEVELVIVIGKRCKHVPRGAAASVIFGYRVGNDFRVRDWQFKTSQFILVRSAPKMTLKRCPGRINGCHDVPLRRRVSKLN